MEKIEKELKFATTFVERSKAIEAGLKKVSEKLIADTKASHSYLVIADDYGNIKKVPAKDL
jgi:hypothetical protein